MKKIYLPIIVILLIVVIILISEILVLRKKTPIPIVEKSAENNLEVSVASISQTDSFYNIQVEYPQFKNADTAFNQKISDLITGEIDVFKKDSKDNWEARRATAPPDNPVPENPTTPFDFIASWTPTQLNNKYLSFVINVYYFSGGAHGITEVDAFNYDVAKKKEIAMTDFLSSSQQSLEKLSQLAVQEVTSQLESSGVQIDDNLKQMIQQGTQSTSDNYKNFNFNYNSVIIYFEQYQVAPGYIGPVTITFYKSTLSENSITSDYLK